MRCQSLKFRKVASIAIFLLLTITPLVSILPVLDAEATGGSAEWWNTSWFKRRPITVNNTLNPNNLTEYQVKVDVNHDSDMKGDFSDLRFTDDNNVTVPYWIEKYTTNVSATIWIRIPSLLASSNATIYMYYGNNAATSTSNGTATFEFFDDFYGTTLNPNKWTEDAVNNITHTVSNYFRFEDAAKASADARWIYDGTDIGSQHHAQWTPLTSFTVDFTSRINDMAGSERGQGFFGLLAPDNTIIGVAGHQDYSPTAIGASRAVAVENTASLLGSGVNKYYLIYWKSAAATDSTKWTIANNGTTLKFYDNAGFYLEAPISSAVSKLALVGGAWEAYPYLDYIQENNVRIRKYTSSEPSSTVGSEEDYRMKAKVMWWNPSWLYRLPINVTENSSSNLTDYQVKLTVDYVSSKMKPDFSDLRFIDNDQATILSYWIESSALSVSAVIWVKIPLIPASDTRTIYMYYGNPSATSAANGKDTFEFYEDFETAYEGPSRWTEEQPLPEGRADPTSAVYGGKIYVFGGYASSTGDVRRETYEYAPSSNSWTRRADMPTARWGPVAVEFNGLIYVFSGTGGSNANEVYNPANDTWTTKNPLPAGLFNQGLMAARYGEKIHLFYTGTHYEYDPATDTYAPKPGMPTGRYWAACAVVNDRIYLIGGYRPSTLGAVNVNEVYDPATNTWATKAPMPVSKWGGGRESPVINGKIYVTHGRDVNYFFGTNYVYDVQTDSWQQKSPALHPRAGSSAAVVNNTLYVIGGVVRVEGQPDVGLAYNEQYDPATDTWIQSPWNFSDPNKVRIDSSAKYEGAHGLLVNEDQGSTMQFAVVSQNFSAVAVDFYWDITDAFGLNTTQPKGRMLLSDASNPDNGGLFYYEDSGAKFYWFREGTYTFLHDGNWNTWYPITVVWNGATSQVAVNGTEHPVSAAQVNSDRIYFGTMLQTKMFIDLVRVRKYVSPPPTSIIGAEEEPAKVQSCDSTGNVKESFYTNELLYVKGSRLMENTDYNLYIVNDVIQWNNGNPIPERISGTTSLVSSDESGNIPTTLAWSSLSVGRYDIIIDALENGLYDSAFDVLGSFEVAVLPLHDIAVTNMTFSETNLGGGYVLMINVTVTNQGDVVEDIDLIVYVNDTIIDIHNVTVANGESTVVNCSWNTTGFSYGYYVVSSHALPVPWETDTADNTLNSTNVFVTISGDVNCDKKVDVYDLWELGKAYASDETKPEWNPNADINNDRIVNNADIAIVNQSLGQKW